MARSCIIFMTLFTAAVVPRLSRHGQVVSAFPIRTTQSTNYNSDFPAGNAQGIDPIKYRDLYKIDLTEDTTYNPELDSFYMAASNLGITGASILRHWKGLDDNDRKELIDVAKAQIIKFSPNRFRLPLRKRRGAAVPDYADLVPLIPPEYGLIIHVHNVEASSNRSIDTTILRLKMALSAELPWPMEDIHVEKINVEFESSSGR